jgi:uracil-DNA glycosylase family 4
MKNFVPDEVRDNAEVFILGQNPGDQEEREGRPFVGQTGRAMDKDFFPAAGLTRESVSIGNAVRCRWNNSNSLPPIEGLLARSAVEHCTHAHLRITSGTRLLIATGGYASLALTGYGHQKNNKITHLRGWMLPLKESLGGTPTCDTDIYTPRLGVDTPVLCTVHVAATGYDPSLRLPTKVDWQKAGRFLKGTWPERPPEIIREVDPDMFDYEAAWDTEYIPESERLIRFSVATAEGKVYVVESKAHLVETLGREINGLSPLPPKMQVGLCLRLVNGVWEPASVEAGPTLRVFFQNASADLPYLARILPEGVVITAEDEMLAHSVLHGGFPHSLDYQASLHASINRHKHLQYTNEVVYSGMDALTQLQVWRATERELRDDPQSEAVYRSRVLPLIPIILEAEEAGILIDQLEVSRGVGYLEHEIEESTRIAQAAAGYKINIGSSQQVGRQLFGVEGLHAPRGKR